jgi:hypothetical protein
MNYILVAAIAFVTLSTSFRVEARECSREEAIAAETVTDYLDSWANVSLFHRQFQHCYDGSVAEAAQDKIQLLWAERWNELPKMVVLTRHNPLFKAFLWRTLESEAFPQDRFSRVLYNASRRCPPKAKEFCRAVKNAASLHRDA